MAITDIERFSRRYMPEPNSGCWIWLGAITGQMGYGAFRMNGRTIGAHRASFLFHKGDVEPGLDVCHSCDVPLCVNPDHLFKGTRSDNVRDCISKGRFTSGDPDLMRMVRFKQEEKTHCPSGHEYNAENTYLHKSKKTTRRFCRICVRLAKMRYRSRANG